MTKKQKQIEFIRAKCIEVNDEIVQLKRNCVVFADNQEWLLNHTYSNGKHEFYENNNLIKIAVDLFEQEMRSYPDFKIIGRDIRLADVLLALYEVKIPSKAWGKDTYERIDLDVSFTGLFHGSAYNWVEEPIFWNLKENLYNQSAETIEFIYNLLSK